MDLGTGGKINKETSLFETLIELGLFFTRSVSSRGPSLQVLTAWWLTSCSTHAVSDPVLHVDWLNALFNCFLIGQCDGAIKPMRPKRVREAVEICSTLTSQLSCKGAWRQI